MLRSEEASQRYSEGWRVGLNDVRVPAPVAKHETQPPLLCLLGRQIRLSSLAFRVLGAVIWRQRQLILTSEVPRRLCPSRQSKRGP